MPAPDVVKLLETGRRCLDSGYLDRASEAFHKALQVDAENFDAMRGLAEIDRRSGRIDAAVKRLRDLIATIQGIDAVFERGDPLPSFDAQEALMSMPYRFGTTLETIPAKVPYISADAALVAQWASRLSDLALSNHKSQITNHKS